MPAGRNRQPHPPDREGAHAAVAPPVGLRPPGGATAAFLILIAALSRPDCRAAIVPFPDAGEGLGGGRRGVIWSVVGHGSDHMVNAGILGRRYKSKSRYYLDTAINIGG